MPSSHNSTQQVPSLNTANSDEDFEDKYQPTLEYLDTDGAEGQDETDGMAAVIVRASCYATSVCGF
jgi:hypothetical protein